MKQKDKLVLIDNYISIFRLLFNCKNIIVDRHNYLYIQSISQLTHQTLELKNNYEKAFEELGLIDEPFMQLQRELNECICQPKHHSNYNLKELENTFNTLQANYIKIKEKLT